MDSSNMKEEEDSEQAALCQSLFLWPTLTGTPHPDLSPSSVSVGFDDLLQMVLSGFYGSIHKSLLCSLLTSTAINEHSRGGDVSTFKEHLFFPYVDGYQPLSSKRCDAGFPAARSAAARTALPLNWCHTGRGFKLIQGGFVPETDQRL